MDLGCWVMFFLFFIIPVYANYREGVFYHKAILESKKIYASFYQIDDRLDETATFSQTEQSNTQEPFWDSIMWADLD